MSSARPDAATRLRVFRVITRLNIGGPALQAIHLTERLDPARFATLLLAGEPSAAEGDMLALRPARARPQVIPTLRREIAPIEDARAFAGIVGAIRAFRPHVVHTHMAKAGLLGRIAARVAGTPIVVHTFHGHVLRQYFDPVRSSAFLALERALARISTRVIAISPRQRAEIEALGIARGPKLVELPLGIELRPFLDPPRGELRRELGIAADAPLIGIVGRLVPVKAVDVFIEAISILAGALPDLRAVIVGDGDLRPGLEAQVRSRGLGGRVRFLGWRADLAPVYGDLDVVVLTSNSEGTPVSVLEALAAARPVVATAVGGVPDVLGDDERGVLVPARDPRAVADAVRRLLADPDGAGRLGRTGRAYVFPAFDVATLVGRIERMYGELAAERGLPRP